jgi:hypothetical protein
MEKELLLKLTDYLICIMEINETARLKNEAIRKQDFKLALELRQKENELSESLMPLEKIKELRGQITQ